MNYLSHIFMSSLLSTALLSTVNDLIEDEGIDVLADFSYTEYMLSSRRPTKIDTCILAAVHDSIEDSAYVNAMGDSCENYNRYRSTLNL